MEEPSDGLPHRSLQEGSDLGHPQEVSNCGSRGRLVCFCDVPGL